MFWFTFLTNWQLDIFDNFIEGEFISLYQSRYSNGGKEDVERRDNAYVFGIPERMLLGAPSLLIEGSQLNHRGQDIVIAQLDQEYGGIFIFSRRFPEVTPARIVKKIRDPLITASVTYRANLNLEPTFCLHYDDELIVSKLNVEVH